MATVKAVMDEAARRCKVTAPTNWITATTDTAMLFKDFLAETVEELLSRVDWPDPISLDTVITGTGVETYSLPSDFKRMTRDEMAVFETTRSQRPCTPVVNNGTWTSLQLNGSAYGGRFYRTSGDDDNGYEISFFRDLETGASVTASYISNKWQAVSGVGSATWTDVTATLLLPSQLVRRGLIWRFRQDKGLPYADRMNEYEANLARLANDAKGIKRIDMGGDNRLSGPWDIPVPDYLPPA